ncbi:MAG TPA: ABC transporter permease [Solirubrobacteraceae bacterium]|nr:ABC transporter permease [Solirubrobacteraceae bacterium]
MSTTKSPSRLRVRRLLPLPTLVYFYRRRLRAHGTQELLAGVGIAVAVALVLAAVVSQDSIVGANKRVLRAVIGPADLQLRSRSPAGFPESLLRQVEAIAGVKQAAPLLERSLRIESANGRTASVSVAGTDTALAVLNGLAHTLPLNALSPGSIGLSADSARALGLTGTGHHEVRLLLDGTASRVPVSSILGPEAVGALASDRVGVMSLSTMQALLLSAHRVTRILVQSKPGQHTAVLRDLQRIADGRLIADSSEEDLILLKQALRPSAEASDLFAVIGAMLGFLLAFNAILLTVPERRQAIADLRISGTTRSAVVQLVLFQALCLGLAASAVGLGVGYLLSRFVFHESTGYLTQAFALANGTVVPLSTLALAALSGIVITCLASAVLLLDLRGGRAPDAIYVSPGVPGNTLDAEAQRRLALGALAMLATATLLYLLAPAAALLATVALAIATVLAAPVAFALVLRVAHLISERAPRLSTLALALSGVRGTTLRSIALAATGAVALFGSVALGGARQDLLAGIRSFAHAYSSDAPIWVAERADDGQATGNLLPNAGAARIRTLPGVASVTPFHSAFMTLGPRKTWVIARPAGASRNVLASETIGGSSTARLAEQRLAEGSWVILSAQIASELHAHIGQSVLLPTPAGNRSYRLAATTTNLAWPPGVVFLSAADFTSAWGSHAPSALAIRPSSGASVSTVISTIRRTLAREPNSSLEVLSASSRQASIDSLTSEGLSQLGLITLLLVLAAVIAIAAALASSVYQRRRALAALRLTGAAPARLRRILLLESSLIVCSGCLTGALFGYYGQFIIDTYLRDVTGFPVSSAGSSILPLEVFALVLAAALACTAIPTYLASRVPPALAWADD